FYIWIVLVAGHFVRDDSGHKGLDRPEHSDGEGGGEKLPHCIVVESRNRNVRQAAGDSAKARADSFYGQMETAYSTTTSKANGDCAGNLAGKFQAKNHDNQRYACQQSCLPVERGKRSAKCHHTAEKISGNRIETQAEEITDLRAGDENGNAVCESNDDRSWKILYGSTHARDAEQQEQNTGHHRTNEKAADAVFGNDSCHDYYERAGRAAYLGFRTAERRNQKTSNDGAIKAGLRREPRGNRESHRERKRDEAD